MAGQDFPQCLIYIPVLSSIQFSGNTQKIGFEQKCQKSVLIQIYFI